MKTTSFCLPSLPHTSPPARPGQRKRRPPGRRSFPAVLIFVLCLLISAPQAVHASPLTAANPHSTISFGLRAGSNLSGIKLATSTKTIALKKITLSKTSATIKTGNTLKLKVTYTPSNTTVSRTVKWSSSNTSVATVKNGKVTAKKVGTATITAKVGSKKATCKVTVKSKYPLKSISLSKTKATITVGKSVTLKVTYKPTNTTDSKTVKWSSSNTSVATVKNGKITGKKAGTATITAKVGSKKATCKVTVKKVSNYKNVSEAYTILNTFRTTKSNQWYWASNNKKKIKTGTLSALKKDSTLEKVAKTRAKEQWTQFYVNGLATHTRPDGSECFTAYPDSLMAMGENLAWGQTSCSEVMTAWIEDDVGYEGQGHRRNMLSKYFTKVGIACYTKNGRTCWVMCLGA